MSDSEAISRRIAKRLLPLYTAAFFQSFVLWYGIEKLFMQSIGFDNATIGVMIAVYSAVMLVVETPSGVLADRWSRKGVLILASICLALSGLIGGLSHGIGVYLMAAVCWGIFYACYSGIYDSIVYDTVFEETGNSRRFEKLYGRVQFMDGLGVVLASLVGGLVVALLDLRAAFFLSVPLAFVAIIALLKFREPTLHKQHVAIPIRTQISSTFRAVGRNRSLLPVVITLILRATLIYILYEFCQVWFLAVNTPTTQFALANAAAISSIGIGGLIASHVRLSRYRAMAVLLSAALIGCAGLIILRNLVAIVAAQMILGTCLIGIAVVFNRILHDELPAAVRAGAASAVSTISRALIIPVALLFGYVSNEFSVYQASYILLALTLLIAIVIMQVAARNERNGLEPSPPVAS